MAATSANSAAEIDMVPMVSNGMPRSDGLLPEHVEHLKAGQALLFVSQHPRLLFDLVSQSGKHGWNSLVKSYRSLLTQAPCHVGGQENPVFSKVLGGSPRHTAAFAGGELASSVCLAKPEADEGASQSGP